MISVQQSQWVLLSLLVGSVIVFYLLLHPFDEENADFKMNDFRQQVIFDIDKQGHAPPAPRPSGTPGNTAGSPAHGTGNAEIESLIRGVDDRISSMQQQLTALQQAETARGKSAAADVSTKTSHYITVEDRHIRDMRCLECERYHVFFDVAEPTGSTLNEVRGLFLEAVKSSVSGYAIQSEHWKMGTSTLADMANFSVSLQYREPFQEGYAFTGMIWPMFGYAMSGHIRLEQVQRTIKRVIDDGIPGDFIECGTWRGGTSISARSAVVAYGSNMTVYVADSFKGLPAARTVMDHDQWKSYEYLQVPVENVKHHFERHYLYDPNKVKFVVGFFNDTMPVVRKSIGKLSILRLDGDMFESCLDILSNLYDKLSVGGWVLIDDWDGFPCATAINLFRQFLNITETLQKPIINQSAFWQKLRDVTFDPVDIRKKVIQAATKDPIEKVEAAAAGGQGAANDPSIMVSDDQGQIKTKPCAQCTAMKELIAGRGPDQYMNDLYLEIVKASVSGYALQTESVKAVNGKLERARFDDGARMSGGDIPYNGYARNGLGTLSALQQRLTDRVIGLGDFVDVGVWRGGTCILAAAIFKITGSTNRVVIVDRFRGQPISAPTFPIPNDNNPSGVDTESLSVSSLENVKHHLRRFFLYDPAKILFSLLPSGKLDSSADIEVQQISVLRIDAALFSGEDCETLIKMLYNRISAKGGVFIDSWSNPASAGCLAALEKFHSMLSVGSASPLVPIGPSANAQWWDKLR